MGPTADPDADAVPILATNCTFPMTDDRQKVLQRLIEAIWDSDVGTVSQLLRSRDLANCHWSGVTPLQWVCRTSANAAILKLLLDAGADPNVLDQDELQNALHYAVDCPIQLVDLLIGAGATVNQQDRDGITPVMMAAKAGRFDIVTILINHGADLRSYDKHLRGPLHWAAIGGDRPELVSCLIEAGADPLVRTAYGMTYKDILELQKRTKSAPGLQ